MCVANPLLITLFSRNRPNYVMQNLMSLSQQTYQDWDLLLVDDASSPAIADDEGVSNVLSRLKSDGHGVNIRRFNQNLGIALARKFVLKGNPETLWKYCFDLNDDHFLENDCIEIMMNTITRSKKIGCVGSATPWISWDEWKVFRKYEEFKEEFNIIRKNDDGTIKSLSRETDHIYLDNKERVLTKPIKVEHCSQFIYKLGLFNPDSIPEDYSVLSFTEETDLCLRIRKAGYKAYFQPNAINWHMMAPSGGVREKIHKKRELCRKDWQIFINNWNKWVMNNG